jgi:DNA-directed RNA polymerase subunit K/omega
MSDASDDSASLFSDDTTEKEESEDEETKKDADPDNVSVRSGTFPKRTQDSAEARDYFASKGEKKGKNAITIVRAPLPDQEDYRRSTREMTIYEYARLVGIRAKMISNNEPIHPKYRGMATSNLILIAQAELDDTDIPFPLKVVRPIGKPNFIEAKIYEEFNARELTLPQELMRANVEDYLPPMNWTVHGQVPSY